MGAKKLLWVTSTTPGDLVVIRGAAPVRRVATATGAATRESLRVDCERTEPRKLLFLRVINGFRYRTAYAAADLLTPLPMLSR